MAPRSRCLALLLCLAAAGCFRLGLDGWPWSDVDADADVPPAGWVTIPSGTFTMGSPEMELGRFLGETQHSVTLAHSFHIQSTEVSQGELEALMGYDPSHFSACGSGCPVEMVSWHEAAAYCNALSDGGGLARCYDCAGSGASVTCSPAAAFASPYACPGYRLPTEAEWERAARAGTTTATHAGDLATTSCPNAVLDPIAWTSCNAGGTTHAAGGRAPNGWGLHDVLGNLWEWCHDWYDDYPAGAATDPWGPPTGAGRVFRGGSWRNVPRYARAASRFGHVPGYRVTDFGFRPARSVP